MDQINLIKKLRRCLEHPNILELETEWPDGRKAGFRFEPWLIGRNLDVKWTFIHGRDVENNKIISIPVPYIVSAVESGEQCTVPTDRNHYFLVSNENVIVKKSIPDILIIDLRDPGLEKEEEKDEECFDFDFEINEERADDDGYDDGEDEYYRQPCTHCGAEGDCGHLVLLYDRSFNECKSGCCKEIQKIETVVQSTFKTWSRDGTKIYCNKKEVNKLLLELWEYSCDSYQKENDEIDFNYDNFSDLIKDILEVESGADFFEYGSGGGPGCDSLMWVFYADNPGIVMQAVETKIKESLEKMTQPGNSAKRKRSRK